MKLDKDKLIAFSILAIGIILYAKSEYSEYKVRKNILEFHELKDEFNIMIDNKLDSIKKEKDQIKKYLNSSINKNPVKLVLHLDSIKTNAIPKEIFKLNNLRELHILSSHSKNGTHTLYDLPYEIQYLPNLEHLNLSNSKVREIPITIIQLKKLKSINVSNTEISEHELRKLESRIPNNCLIIN